MAATVLCGDSETPVRRQQPSEAEMHKLANNVLLLVTKKVNEGNVEYTRLLAQARSMEY